MVEKTVVNLCHRPSTPHTEPETGKLFGFLARIVGCDPTKPCNENSVAEMCVIETITHF